MINRITVILISIIFIFPVIAHTQIGIQDERSRFRDDLSSQRETDRAAREKVLAEVRAHMDDINSRLAIGSKSRLDIPIDDEYIEDAEEYTHIHTDKKIPPARFAYVNAQNLNMRAMPSRDSESLGRISHGQRVQLLVRYEEKETIDGAEDYWIMVRRDSGDEGWVFGAYLQNEKPVKRLKPERATPASSGFIMPAEGRRTSDFGYRVHPVTRKSHSFHSGIDIAAPTGTPVRAAESGRVTTSNFNRGGYGNLIIIQHESDLATYYGHLHRRYKNSGDMVKKGEIIGEVGATGTATGPHLHFEVRRGSTALNPDQFLR